MLRTAFASIFIILLGWYAASWLTLDFQIWTDEGARRLEVTLHPVEIPSVLVEGPDVTETELLSLLREDNTVTIVDFIYTNCQAVCLSLGGIFQQMQKALSNIANSKEDEPSLVRLLSISFDRERDDLSTLQAYADSLSAKSTYWRFVRVTQAEQLQNLLQRLGVIVIPDGLGDFEHNAALLVFDASGRMVRIFDMQEHQLALNYARQLQRKQLQKTSL